MNTTISATAMQALHRRLVDALSAHNGTAWKEVYSEPHLHYNEIPIWVLLYEDSVPEQSHAVFRRSIVPFLDGLSGVELTLMYYVVRERQRYHLDFLTTTSHILSSDGGAEALGAWQKQSNAKVWLFTSFDSARP